MFVAAAQARGEGRAPARRMRGGTGPLATPVRLRRAGIARKETHVDERAPVLSAPWTAPAAPPSDCMTVQLTGWPNAFSRPSFCQASTNSPIALVKRTQTGTTPNDNNGPRTRQTGRRHTHDDGVIGKMNATSVKWYATRATASLPSTMKVFSPSTALAWAENVREKDRAATPRRPKCRSLAPRDSILGAPPASGWPLRR